MTDRLEQVEWYAARLAEVEAERDKLLGLVHSCPTCGASCKECECMQQWLAAAEAEIRKLKGYVNVLASKLAHYTGKTCPDSVRGAEDICERLAAAEASVHELEETVSALESERNALRRKLAAAVSEVKALLGDRNVQRAVNRTIMTDQERLGERLKAEERRCNQMADRLAAAEYGSDQHDLICEALGVGVSPDDPGDTAYEAVARQQQRLAEAEALLREAVKTYTESCVIASDDGEYSKEYGVAIVGSDWYEKAKEVCGEH